MNLKEMIMARRCKYGKLKSPARTKSGRKRICKLKPKGRKKRRR
jgi:hypothetical protein